MHGPSSSAVYYRNREHAERAQAEQAISDHIPQIHLTMAERYRELAEQAELSAVPGEWIEHGSSGRLVEP